MTPRARRIGRGENRLGVAARGGSPVIGELGFAQLSYGRRLSDMSAASATLDLSACDPDLLATIEPWEHEIVVWRDGEVVWVGPLVGLSFTETQVSLAARDLFQWFERRLLPTDRNLDTDIGLVFGQYAADALATDPSPGVVLRVVPAGIVGQRSVLATDFVRAADQLRELGRSGIDWTMRGRELLAGGTNFLAVLGETSILPPLTIEQVNAPVFVRDGLTVATRAVFKGAFQGTDAVVGDAGGVDPERGLLEIAQSEFSIEDASSAQAAAEELLAVSITAEGMTCRLLPDCGIAFDELVPGARVPVAMQIGIAEIVQTFRLVEVGVEAGDAESVTVTLGPLGEADASAS